MTPRFYNQAWRKAFSSPYPLWPKRMAALVVKGGKVLSCAVNHTGKHAEVRALRPHRDYVGATVYVARANGRISRPCRACLAVLKAAGISSTVYAGPDGQLIRETIV